MLNTVFHVCFDNVLKMRCKYIGNSLAIYGTCIVANVVPIDWKDVDNVLLKMYC